MSSISLASSSVTAAALLANYTVSATHKAGETSATAINIGNLQQSGTSVSLTDSGSTSGDQSYSFTLKAGDNLFLNSNFSNVVDQVTTRVQVYDSNGNLIADNQGDTALAYAYTQLVSTGLTPGAGNYTIKATPLSSSSGSPDLSLTALNQQGTSLSVNSTLNSAEPAEYYNFSLADSNNIKLAFNSNASSSTTRIQLYDGNGNLIADSRGSSYLQDNFNQLTSGTGLPASGGNYQVKVSYADGVTPTDSGINYNFQLYSGSAYAVQYTTNAAAPAASTLTAASSVTAGSNATLSTQSAYHQINETAQTGVSIGYLQQDKTSLNVYSILSPVDSTDYYNFILQSGNNLKLSLANVTNPSDTSASAIHLQVLDSSGSQVIADNQGTSAQKEAFAALTSATGLTAQAGTYVVKATYGSGASKQNSLEYNFQLYSGTTYTASYKTTASAQTYENALLSGTLGSGSSAALATANYLTSASNGSPTDIISALQTIA